EIEKITVTPATVELIGPEKRLANIESISTAPVDLDGRIRSINKRRTTLATGESLTGVRLSPPNVTLDVTVVERSISSRFPDVPVLPLLPVGRMVRADLEPETVTLTLKGRPELIRNMEAEEFRLFVDATDIANATPVKRAVRADLPPGITLVRAEPSSVTVQLKD
ncbi:MAG: hypothetical protein LBN38_00975, partial [Verrucomicrobiota bacterium]|nr:hypothetical protein [Verrucomicrobiota bacterium]